MQNLFVPQFINQVDTIVDPGDPPLFAISVIDSLGIAIDLTDYDLVWKVRSKRTGSTYDLKAPDSIEIVNAPLGYLRMRLEYGDLAEAGGYFHKLLGNYSGQGWHTLAIGSIDISQPLMREGIPGGFFGDNITGELKVDWDDVTNKPSEFPPEPHTHTESDITDLERMRYLGDWVAGNYEAQDVVNRSGFTYVALRFTSETPSGSATDWDVLGGSGGGSSVHVGVTPPGSPGEGDLWINTSNTRIYSYWNDGTSSQWVDISK